MNIHQQTNLPKSSRRIQAHNGPSGGENPPIIKPHHQHSLGLQLQPQPSHNSANIFPEVLRYSLPQALPSALRFIPFSRLLVALAHKHWSGVASTTNEVCGD
uniref:Uncharacterized protein n=1 Tax=Opuntia streptacantha TaxID=393608 RepID=A0A7C9D700_OPUST